MRARAATVGTALLQHACLSGAEAGLVGIDAALHRSLTTVEALERELPYLGAAYGVAAARAAVSAADGRRESPGESRTAWALRTLGLAVTPQFEVLVGRDLFRADFRIDGTRVLVEFDGRSKYASPADLWAEKRREDALRLAGWTVVRVTWADLDDLTALDARIRSALRLAAS